MHSSTLQLVNEFAPGYDEYIKNNGWHGPDMLFGMMYEYLLPGQRMLDLGIGTGISAALFYKAGLEIYGIDGSDEMLKICKSKNIAVELKLEDLCKSDIAFDKKFHHIVSFAVFHFMDNLCPLFSNISKQMEPGGTFGFSADIYNPGIDQDLYKPFMKGVFQKINQESGLKTYKHTFDYLNNSLKATGFKIQKSTDILAFKDIQESRNVWFNLIVATLE